jgi:anti-anti-sigma factor
VDQVETGAGPLLEVDVSIPEPSVVVIRLAGELDLSNISQLEAEASPALATRPERLVLDGARLEFADSSAIALWLRWAASVQHFELHNLSPLLRRVLSAMGLDRRLELRP